MVMIARDKRMDCSNHISLPLIQKYLNMKITKLKFWKNLVELLRSFYDEVVEKRPFLIEKFSNFLIL